MDLKLKKIWNYKAMNSYFSIGFSLTVILLSFLLSSVIASEYSIKGTETVAIRSDINQQEYELLIRLPRDYVKSKNNYPVAILNDVGYSFPIALRRTKT